MYSSSSGSVYEPSGTSSRKRLGLFLANESIVASVDLLCTMGSPVVFETSTIGSDLIHVDECRAQMDGATAAEMEKEDWKELGATGIQASVIVGHLKKIDKCHEKVPL